jgi:polyisoprenoid-binding protein YceI
MIGSMRAALSLGIAATLALGLSARFALAETFTLDSARSELVVRTFKDGLAARFAHDHVVQATAFSGVIEYDQATPDMATITVEVQTDSLRVDDPALRRKFGLPGEPSARDVADIVTAMRSPGQLDVARFRSIRFASSRVARQPDGQYAVTGELTIRGVTREVRFPARVTLEGLLLRGRATLTIAQSSFGYQPYSALLGTIKNKDEVILYIDLVATR